MCLSSADLIYKVGKINALLLNDNYDMNLNSIFKILGLPELNAFEYCLPINFKIKKVEIGRPIEGHDGPSRGPVYPLVYIREE